MQRRINDFKLPVILPKTRQNTKQMANTITATNFHAKVRPSSLQKVQDLQKKLFSKLDSYQTVTKINTAKRYSRKGKGVLIEAFSDNQKQTEGYQKLQKLMPQLYSKLIQAKKGSSMIDILPENAETSIIKGQTLLSKQIAAYGSENKPKEPKKDKYQNFMTSPTQNSINLEQTVMSKEQMQELFSQYSKQQGFTKQTSTQQLQSLGKSIVICQKQIQSLTKSMEGLIREIGLQCLSDFQNDTQLY